MDTNSVDTYISGGTTIVNTGFSEGVSGDMVILSENPKTNEIATDTITEYINGVTNSPSQIITSTETPNTTETPSETPSDSGIILNQPIHKFMSNANPFFIGIGVVVVLIILGDFFKPTNQE